MSDEKKPSDFSRRERRIIEHQMRKGKTFEQAVDIAFKNV